jgi:hypothetical protein
MAQGEASRWIGCDADRFLAFALDVERYREVDDKLGPIDWVRTDEAVTEFRFRPTLPGLPPAPKTVSRMRLTPSERIDIQYASGPQNRLVRLFSVFNASFTCVPDGDGVRVTRRLSLSLRPPLGWLVDGYLQRRLQASVDRELDLAPAALGVPSSPPRG